MNEDVNKYNTHDQQDPFESDAQEGLAMLGQQREELLARLKGKLEDQHIPKRENTSKYSPYWLVLLLVAFACFLAYMLSSKEQKLEPQEIFAMHYEYMPSTISATVRGSQTELEKGVLDKAMIAYENREFENAHRLFSSISESPLKDKYQFYHALTLMELQNYKEAEQLFGNLQNSISKEYRPSVVWYRALNLLNLNQIEKAHQLLTEIASDTYHYKRASAQTMIEQIKSE